MRRIVMLGLGLLGAAGLAACSEEAPTSLGSEILGEGFRTFVVVLEASEFLERDTTYDRIGSLNEAPFGLVAEAFEDELYAHTLFKVNPPTQVTYENAGGNTVTDTAFTVVGGELTVVLDSASAGAQQIVFEVVEVTESWDPATVTWEQRFDTAGVSAAWTEPGGTTGDVLGSELRMTGDTVRIPLSAATAALEDSAAAEMGALLRSSTGGVRVRVQSMAFAFRVRPEGSPDTVVTAGTIGRRIPVASPAASIPDPTELRVGGVPVWRSALRFRPLADVEIPCSPGSTSCAVRLGDVNLNQAALMLQPLPVAGHRIERPFNIEGRALLRAPDVPLSRSPLSTSLGGTVDSLEPEIFVTATTPVERVALPFTRYVRQNLNPGEGRDPILWVALVAVSEQQAPVFGYAAFGSLVSAAPPQLRLVVTVPVVEEESQ